MRILKAAVTGHTRLVAALGTSLAIASLVTAAAFTDFANLNLGTGTPESGIGSESRFNIQVVGTDASGVPQPGSWQEAETEEGVNIAIPGASTITPGDTISVEIPFRNESPALSAAIRFSLQDRPNMTSGLSMRDALRYTVSLNGSMLITDVPQEDVTDLDLGTYPTGAEDTLTIGVTLPDQGIEANNAVNGQVSYVRARFDATSVQPEAT